jgi:hypothetical protein
MENAIAVPMANAVAVQMEIRHAAVVRSRLESLTKPSFQLRSCWG